MPNTNTKLVDSKTIAALFELTPRRIQQLTKEGIITATKEGNANRYDLLPTIQKYIRYLTAKANGREPSKKDAEIEGRRLEAEADLKRSKADIAALQLQKREIVPGNLCTVFFQPCDSLHTAVFCILVKQKIGAFL